MRLARGYASAPSIVNNNTNAATAHASSVGTGVITGAAAAITATELVPALFAGVGSVMPAGTLAVAVLTIEPVAFAAIVAAIA